ncbi:MAG: aminoglycoside phosphotransferase family protein [Cyclobacteriaceae bacterium]
MKEPQIGEILNLYHFTVSPVEFERFGSGHIHQTYRIHADGRFFILQKFNQTVFKYPDRISFNQQYLLNQFDPKVLPFELPLPIKNKDDQFFSQINGELFRIFPFVKGMTKDAVDKKSQARMASEAFAHFISAFSQVDASVLQESIPDFHNLVLRYEQFEKSIKNPKIQINAETRKMIEFYLDKKKLLEKYRYYQQHLPKRVTHNDTKINNLIFNDPLDKVNAVIDLDTIMAGFVFYDFGDLVRTVACREDESSLNWGAIHVDLEKYEGLLEGFIPVLKGKVSAQELKSISFGGEMMTLIMGLRFLTDHLNGNIYYHVNYEEQNFHRSKNQSELLDSLIHHRNAIRKLEENIS